MRILLVEDDAMLGAALVDGLRDAAYAVDWVRDGQSGIDAFLLGPYGLVLLDLGLPKSDGIEVLKCIRATPNSPPVIIITARDATDDCVRGLDNGADDYLIKPFDMPVLFARMRAITRRNGHGAVPTLSNGRISLDPATFEASHDGGTSRLTAREFALLRALMIRPGTILSRSDLEQRIYGWNEEVESNAVEFIIHTIRKKIGSRGIRNVRGVGWMVDKCR